MYDDLKKTADYRERVPAQYELYEEIKYKNVKRVLRDDRPILKASEVLNRIKKGIPVENIIVNEDIIYSKSDNERTINKDVKINNCEFNGEVSLESLIFEGKINISYVIFNQITSFSGSHFKKSAIFSKVFNENVDFSGAIFDKEASFSNSTFKNTVYFSRRVDDEFRHATFNEFAEFMNSQFNSIDFEGVRFEGDVYFRESHFEGILDFRAYFNRAVEFDTIRIVGPQFRDGCKIRLAGAKFDKLRVHWNDIKDHLEGVNPSDLRSLVNNYSELGWFDDTDRCYLAYKKLLIHNDYLVFLVSWIKFKSKIFKYIKIIFRRRRIVNKQNIYLYVGPSRSRTSKLKSLGKFISEFLKISFMFLIKILHYVLSLTLYGHGVKLMWPIASGVFLLLLSAYIYYSAGQVDTWLEGVKISAKILIVTTQVGNTTTVASLTRFCEWWSIIERFLGWLVMTTFLVVLAKKTLR